MAREVKLAPGLIVVVCGGVQDELGALDGVLVGVEGCMSAQDEIVCQYVVRGGAGSTPCLQL